MFVCCSCADLPLDTDPLLSMAEVVSEEKRYPAPLTEAWRRSPDNPISFQPAVGTNNVYLVVDNKLVAWSLPGQNINGAAGKAIADYCATSRVLTAMDLSDNNLADQSVRKIVESLRQMDVRVQRLLRMQHCRVWPKPSDMVRWISNSKNDSTRASRN